MAEKLGILVGTDEHLEWVVQLTVAAHAKGKQIDIFFTGAGVKLTQHENFKALVGRARIAVCDVSFRAFGLSGDVPGVGFQDFATQARTAEMINDCDRYVAF